MTEPDDDGRARWQVTTHDWMRDVDRVHLAAVRRRAGAPPTGPLHLVLEVLAYASDEAESLGRVGRKPVMATRDLRFFDAASPPLLPDGYPRRGMSVVAALSDRLVHVNRRPDGARAQTYGAGVPVDDLVPVGSDGRIGTIGYGN